MRALTNDPKSYDWIACQSGRRHSVQTVSRAPRAKIESSFHISLDLHSVHLLSSF